jgi:hypothetical protein
MNIVDVSTCEVPCWEDLGETRIVEVGLSVRPALLEMRLRIFDDGEEHVDTTV